MAKGEYYIVEVKDKRPRKGWQLKALGKAEWNPASEKKARKKDADKEAKFRKTRVNKEHYDVRVNKYKEGTGPYKEKSRWE